MRQIVRSLRKAANKGNADAQCLLGMCYHKGEGVTQDFAEGRAAVWAGGSAG